MHKAMGASTYYIISDRGESGFQNDDRVKNRYLKF